MPAKLWATTRDGTSRAAFAGFNWAVLWYFLVLNSWYLVLIVIASFDAYGHFRALPYAGYDDIFSSPLTPPVSVVVPARNEEVGIVESTARSARVALPEARGDRRRRRIRRRDLRRSS